MMKNISKRTAERGKAKKLSIIIQIRLLGFPIPGEGGGRGQGEHSI